MVALGATDMEAMMSNSDLVDIDDVELRQEREKSFAVWTGKKDDQNREVWVFLPKAHVEHHDGVFTMPEWLALELELI